MSGRAQVASTRRHGPGCACQRCVPFGRGNAAAVTHGSYSAPEVIARSPRTLEIAEGITVALEAEGLWRPVFAPTVTAAAIVLTRVERAQAALHRIDEELDANDASSAAYLGVDRRESLARLRDDLRKWTEQARRFLNDLGCTPAAFARIAKDTGLARATRAEVAIRELRDHVSGTYAREGES